MNEKEFFEKIKEKSGWDFYSSDRNRRFGFIVGTQTPFIYPGMTSAMKSEGFNIWKIIGKRGHEVNIQTKTQEEAFDKIIEFLKSPIPENLEDSFPVYSGEFDEIPFG